jgi:tRNA dimethylallyltransferase
MMVEAGLVEEVQGLLDRGCTREMVSMQGLGYKEMIDYLKGSCTLEEAVYTIKRDTRHFAKRQLTWFAREREVLWLDKECFLDEQELLFYMLHVLQEKQIINGPEQ